MSGTAARVAARASTSRSRCGFWCHLGLEYLDNFWSEWNVASLAELSYNVNSAAPPVDVARLNVPGLVQAGSGTKEEVKESQGPNWELGLDGDRKPELSRAQARWSSVGGAGRRSGGRAGGRGAGGGVLTCAGGGAGGVG